VSHHVKALHAAGLIAVAKKGKHYDIRVNRELLARAAALLERLAGCCQTASPAPKRGGGRKDGNR
jgi:hypothetical protein